MGGGIAVFVRNEIKHMIKFVPNTNQESIWIKIKKEEIEEAHDIYIGTVYISPNENNENNSEEPFFKEVRHFSEKGIVFIQGDFNTHTGNVH